MKKRKRIMCSGLAFGDKEDMEMLHKYALEGWIFREFKGIHYILHKEEPQDIIFSYEFRKLEPDEEEDYLAMFEAAGWHSIPCKGDLRFFWAKNGTTPLHTDQATEGEQYKGFAKWSFMGFLMATILFLMVKAFIPTSLETLHFVLDLILLPTMLVTGLTALGCFVRTKNKRLFFTISFKSNLISLALFSIAFLLLTQVPHSLREETYPLFLILFAICGAAIGALAITLITKFPLYRDKKVK